jgi:hypothetical protein
MTIAEDAFGATMRADTASSNLSAQVVSLYNIAGYIESLVPGFVAYSGPQGINVSTVDTSGAPVFSSSFASPGSVPTPSDYTAQMITAFNNKNTYAPSEVNNSLNTWLTLYAPGYLTAMASLDALLAQGVMDGDPLGEDVQTALYTKAQNQIDAAAKSAYETAMRAVRGVGWEVVPPMQEAVLYRFAQSTADAEIAAAIDAYLKTYEIRVNHKQLCMKLQTDIRNATQTAMMNMVGVLAGLKKFAMEYAVSEANIGLSTYKAQIEGFKALLEANVRTFEAAVSGNTAQLESYKTKLEAQIKNAGLLLDKYKVQIDNATIPYKGLLETSLAQYTGKINGYNTLSSAVSGATHALGQYASSCANVMNSIVSSSEQV